MYKIASYPKKVHGLNYFKKSLNVPKATFGNISLVFQHRKIKYIIV